MTGAIVLARLGASITINGVKIPHLVINPVTGQPSHRPVVLTRTETVMRAIIAGDLIEFEPMPLSILTEGNSFPIEENQKPVEKFNKHKRKIK